MSLYDFIIVGSGPAGSILASTLARTKARPSVLLLEAGAKDETSTGYMTERYQTAFASPNLNWGYSTVPQKYLDNRVVDYSRGKTVGGSSAVNFGAYTVGPADDYHRWAELVGDDSFSWKSAVQRRKTYERYQADIDEEHKKYFNPSLHGTNGQLNISVPPSKTWEPLLTHLMDAAEEAGLGTKTDLNDGEGFGLACCVATMNRKLIRETAATAFLANVPGNLEIKSTSLVTKVIFDGKRAVGVQTEGGDYHANNEVILCAGSIDTPKLLMLSGIGNSNTLKQHGINPLIHLAGIGQNLQDHPMFVMDWIMKPHFSTRATLLSNPETMAAARKQLAADGTGPLSILFTSMGMGYFRQASLLSHPSFRALQPAEQQYISQPNVPTWEIVTLGPVLNPTADPSKTYLTIMGFLHSVQSKGSITLASNNPLDAPLSDPNFLESEFDKANMIATVREMLKFVETPMIATDMIEAFTAPSPMSTDEEILAWARQNVGATWHPSCTVKMGKKDDEMACVDNDFKVFGTEALRVADMSVSPFMMNCHTQSVAYWIGATAAEKLVAEYGLDA